MSGAPAFRRSVFGVRCSAFASPSPFAIFPVPVSILISILLGLWVLDALLMVLVILMQRPKSEGLGAAFGGAVTENIFGAQTTNVLVKFTGWLAGFFFVLTFLLSVLYAHRSMGDSALRRELMKTQQSAPLAPAPGATNSVPPVTAPAPADSTRPIDAAVGAVPAAPVPAAPSAAPASTPPPKPSP